MDQRLLIKDAVIGYGGISRYYARTILVNDENTVFPVISEMLESNYGQMAKISRVSDHAVPPNEFDLTRLATC